MSIVERNGTGIHHLAARRKPGAATDEAGDQPGRRTSERDRSMIDQFCAPRIRFNASSCPDGPWRFETLP
jgi:hypothetical protein